MNQKKNHQIMIKKIKIKMRKINLKNIKSLLQILQKINHRKMYQKQINKKY